MWELRLKNKKLFIATSLLCLMACGKNYSQPSAHKSSDDKTKHDSIDYISIKKLGGESTSLDENPTSHAYRYPVQNLQESELGSHLEGDKHFETLFVDDPGRFEKGLGPVFNNNACVSCHNLDGRGSLPVGVNAKTWTKIEQNSAIFLRISIENENTRKCQPSEENKYCAPVAVPGFSAQLFHLGSYDLRNDEQGVGQAKVFIKLAEKPFHYPDGKSVSLTKPVFKIENPYDEDLAKGISSRLFASDVKTSPRLGLPMYGLGLLEAIPEKEILAQLDQSHKSEGVYGKANFVFDAEKSRLGVTPARSLGRFGLKATTPSVLQQSLGALNGDMGVTNFLFPTESIAGTPLFDLYAQEKGITPSIEASEEVSRSIVFYSRTLAVPPRRNIDDFDVKEGGRLFNQARCTSCHRPAWTTGNTDISALSGQKIYPFTDMLLHDMGKGLADDRQDFQANGREWRTRALWGIGLTHVVNPRAGFLHDGRAKSFEEAVLWHDGEARYSRDKFANLSSKQRKQLILFLQSL